MSVGLGKMRSVQLIAKDISKNWLNYVMLSWLAAIFLIWYFELGFRTLPPWAEWHSIEAYYDTREHAVVISSRSWTIHNPCPENELLRRDAVISGQDRVLYNFPTSELQKPRNELGAHSTGEPLVIRLVDSNGKYLDLIPERVRLVGTCGQRRPVVSEWVDLVSVEGL